MWGYMGLSMERGNDSNKENLNLNIVANGSSSQTNGYPVTDPKGWRMDYVLGLETDEEDENVGMNYGN